MTPPQESDSKPKPLRIVSDENITADEALRLYDVLDGWWAMHVGRVLRERFEERDAERRLLAFFLNSAGPERRDGAKDYFEHYAEGAPELRARIVAIIERGRP